jgi:D-alanyl-D-alanine carboxypeptidase/D-alanyl-D-alanine-endopeptidase (penicillin-binding protein 4)
VLLAGCAARAAAPRLAPEVAALGGAVDSVLADPAFSRARWGAVIESADSGQVLYRRDAARLFIPASNQKLLTTAAALARLGPDFRWTTTVLARGPRRGDTLSGDLLVVGRGDPTFAVDETGDSLDVLSSLRPLVDSLLARGIKVVRGRIVGEAGAFPDPPLGRGWAWDDLDADYSAPVGALQFNESVAWIEVTPSSTVGAAARLLLQPFGAPLRVYGIVTTVPADSSVGRLVWSRAPFGDSVTVGGALPAGHLPVRLPVAVPDPTRYFEAALSEALADGGIAVQGGMGSGADTAATDTLFTWQSPPLSAVLPLLLKPSQNQIAETLLRTLGLQVKGVGSVDSGRAVLGDVLTELGAPLGAWVIADGSGLSRYDDVAPEAIAAVLEAMYHRPDFQIFLDALPVAGVDGTLSTRLVGTAAAGNARAKTGSMAGVRTLSGYVRTADGETLLFVLMANNVSVPGRLVEGAQDRIVARLAGFRRSSR